MDIKHTLVEKVVSAKVSRKGPSASQVIEDFASLLSSACPTDIWRSALVQDFGGYGRVGWGKLSIWSRKLNSRQQIRLISPPDGDCGLHSLLQFHTYHYDPQQTQEQVMQEIVALWKVLSQGLPTISYTTLLKITQACGIPTYHEEQVLELARSGKIVYKDLSGGAIVLAAKANLGHVGFTTGRDMTRGRSLNRLRALLQAYVKNIQLPNLIRTTIPNSAKTMKNKAANKEARKVKHLTPEQILRNQFYRDLRARLAVDLEALPTIGDVQNTKDWSYFVTCQNLGWRGQMPNVVENKRSYVVASSFCKREFDNVWRQIEIEKKVIESKFEAIRFGSNLTFKFDLPPVSTLAERTIGTDAIVGLHQKDTIRVTKTLKTTHGQLVSRPVNRKVEFEVRGSMNGRFAEVLQAYGLPISKDAMT